jgi:hypothetical protein
MRGVTFKETVAVREIPYASPQDYSRIWYAHWDFHKFQTRDDRILERMERDARYIKRNGDSTRGVERLQPKARERLMVKRIEAHAAVFETQRDQILSDTNEPEEIANAYRRVCESSVKDAFVLGLRYEKIVSTQVKASTRDAQGVEQLLTKEAFPNLKLHQKALSPTKRGKRQLISVVVC